MHARACPSCTLAGPARNRPYPPHTRSPPPPPSRLQVKLVDQCASCSCGDVDLSSRGLNAATGFSWDRKRIEWEWDPDCSGGSSSRSNDSEDSSPSPSPDANNDSNVSATACPRCAMCLPARLRCPGAMAPASPPNAPPPLPQCEDGYKWSKRKHKCYKKKDRRLMTEEA